MHVIRSYLKDVIEGVLKVNIDGLRLRSFLKLIYDKLFLESGLLCGGEIP
jgi:hypothetical protein